MFGNIPGEADMRRATRSIPMVRGQPHFDPRISRILEGKEREGFLDSLAHRPNGRILDVCCGPGWLSLELARRGQSVDAYDISDEAIALAKRMLEENPFKQGFGEINYHLQDISQVDLGVEKYDGIAGWSAFHHLPNLADFMERAWNALKPGGIIATMDDMPQKWVDKALSRLIYTVWPSYYMSYPQKLKKIVRVLVGSATLAPEVFSPLEEDKHMLVYDIAEIFAQKFQVLQNFHFNSFAGQMMSVKGPDWFRCVSTRLLIPVDRFLCRTGLCQGFLRIMIAQKPAK